MPNGKKLDTYWKAMLLTKQSFSVCAPPPPPPVRYALPVTEHFTLHSKLLCENMARTSSGRHNGGGTKLGGGGGGAQRKRYLGMPLQDTVELC